MSPMTRRWMWFLPAAALATASSVYAAPAAPEEVDFRAVNPVLQSLVEAVAAGDELIDFAYPRFDESQCDLRAEKIKYDIQGSLKSTPWLEGGRAEVIGSSRYWTERTVGHTGVQVKATGSVRTDVMALIRYSAYIADRKVGDREIQSQFLARFRAHLKRLAVATSLDQLHSLLVSGRALSKDMFAFYLDREIKKLQCMESGQCAYPGTDMQAQITRQKSFIESLRQAAPAYDQVTIQPRMDGSPARVSELTVCSPDAGLFILDRDKERSKLLLIPGRACVVVTEQAISAELTAFHKVPLADLNQMKKELESRLIGAQNGAGQDKDYIQRHFREALVIFKKTLRGGW